jgi:hypothetical protein
LPVEIPVQDIIWRKVFWRAGLLFQIKGREGNPRMKKPAMISASIHAPTYARI